MHKLILFILCLVFVLSGAHTLRAQQVFEFQDGQFKQVAKPDYNTPEGLLAWYRELIADGRSDEVICCLDQWIKDNFDSPLRPEAFILRGDAKAANDDLYDALFDYEAVAKYYPSSRWFPIALERQFAIGYKFAYGRKRKADFWRFTGILFFLAEVPMFSTFDSAEELLIRIQERSPGSVIAERAGKELADLYYRRGLMTKAATAFELFRKNYPVSEWQEYALQRQIEANFAQFKSPEFDATSLLDAQAQLFEFKQLYPAAAQRAGVNELLLRVDEALAAKKLNAAQWYEKQNNYASMRYMYYMVIVQHPASNSAFTALKKLERIDKRLHASGLILLARIYPNLISIEENTIELAKDNRPEREKLLRPLVIPELSANEE